MSLFDYTHTPSNPRDLFEAYRHLRVDLYDGHTFTVDLHKYRNAGFNAKNKQSAKPSIEEWEKRLSPMLDRAWAKQRFPRRGIDRVFCVDTGKACLEEPYDRRALGQCFWAQQAPAAYAKVLRMAVAVGRIGKTQRDLQEYCDKYLGIDCKGFAYSFIGGPIALAEERPDLSEIVKMGTMVTSIDQIQGHEIIIWNDFGHIAVINSVESSHADPRSGAKSKIVEVVESTGSQRDKDGPEDGVQLSYYQIDSDKSGMRIYRPYAKGVTVRQERVTLYRFKRSVSTPLPPAFPLSDRPSFPPLRLN